MSDIKEPLPGPVKGIIFDVDNTLYNFFDAKILACERVCETIGAGNGQELFRYFLSGKRGFENPENIRDYMTDLGVSDESESLFKNASCIYEDVKLSSITLYPGVPELIRELHESGMRLTIVTDADSIQAKKRLTKLELYDYFESVITPDVTGKRKPDPLIFFSAMEVMNTTPEETMVVGDSPKREIEPGNKLGLTTVYAKYGDWLKTPFPSIKPDHVLEKFYDLRTILDL
ncbi:HAD family hydrolase [Methanolacinia petrolearia]|uniref:HAD family hydrolase n=1 Tax=Methanolacinia petrolearia TaxID=54120 RepID=UPI003BA8F4AA